MKRSVEGVSSPYFVQSKESKASPIKRSKKEKFDGIPVEQILEKKLPDHLAPNLDILFVGINPGLMSAFKGHHYCGHNNHFWPCLYESGLVPEKLTFTDDHRCLEYKIGLTNIVERTTRSSSDLSTQEIKAGIEEMNRKVAETNPVIVCFNGKGIYEVFSKKKCNVGLQSNRYPGTNSAMYVMPSTSGRTMSYPRKSDKLVFFQELKQLLESSRKENTLQDK
ncbi:G/T mismatch-specific thymine DNA glycosylase-like [Rhopilema esculentum]|uniref:G/T mismatch-specific thymine DNA glycosylase-like n=1 Tax=Rhopilema esculentum TaxID=499914 RepID=UPI0031D1EC80